MKEKFIAGICILFLNSFLFVLNAQNIKLSLKDGNTVEGYIKYNGWIKTPDEIEITSGNETFTYNPSQVREFEINGDRYISKTIDLNITNQSMQKLTDFKKLEYVTKEVFLKVIVIGDVSLYSYKDSRTHFIVEKGDKIVELIRLVRSSKSSLNQYVGQLNIFFADCEKLSNNNQVQFSKTSLKRVVLAYNDCKSGQSSYVESKHPLQLSLYAMGGFKFTSYEIPGSRYQIESTGGTPAYGIGLDIDLLRRTNRLQVHTDFLLQSYQFEGYYRDQRLPEQYIDYFLDVDLDYLEIGLLLRYNFGNESDKVRVFANAGVNQGIKVSDKSSEYSNSVFFSNENRRESEPLDGEIVSSRTSFSVGAGLSYKFVTGELRYGFNPELSGFPSTSTTDNLNLLLAFKIL